MVCGSSKGRVVENNPDFLHCVIAPLSDNTALSHSSLLQETSLEHESALVGFAIDFVVTCTFGQADAFDLRAFFKHDG
jgi:hypothetical protein